jgi:hypothetical protein
MATAPGTSVRGREERTDAPVVRGALWGLGVGAVLLAAALAVPVVTGIRVRSGGAPPLLGDWVLRYGPSSAVAVALVVLGVVPSVRARVAATPWRTLLALTWPVAVVWMVSLALVDGVEGLGVILDHGTEYLQSARMVDDVGELLRTYVARIPLDSADNLAVHLAGHPPGAVLMFVGLVRLGLGSYVAAGLVIVAIGATVPAAVALTLDRLGSRDAARAALPFLVVGPSAVFMAVSADAVFTATAAWGMAALAASCAARGTRRRWVWAVVAGLLLGWCLMESYGLVLLAVLALAVLASAPGAVRSRAAVAAVAGGVAVAVVVAFALLGFAWWEAFPVLRERYWAGIAGTRPGWYWVFGNLGALLLCAGPMLAAGLGAGVARIRRVVAGRPPRPWIGRIRAVGDPHEVRAGAVGALVVAGAAMVLVADLSQMSRAEVERIWLPFVPWLLLSVAWLPPRWQRWGLLAQGVTALLVQHLVHTPW